MSSVTLEQIVWYVAMAVSGVAAGVAFVNLVVALRGKRSAKYKAGRALLMILVLVVAVLQVLADHRLRDVVNNPKHRLDLEFAEVVVFLFLGFVILCRTFRRNHKKRALDKNWSLYNGRYRYYSSAKRLGNHYMPKRVAKMPSEDPLQQGAGRPRKNSLLFGSPAQSLLEEAPKEPPKESNCCSETTRALWKEFFNEFTPIILDVALFAALGAFVGVVYSFAQGDCECLAVTNMTGFVYVVDLLAFIMLLISFALIVKYPGTRWGTLASTMFFYPRALIYALGYRTRGMGAYIR